MKPGVSRAFESWAKARGETLEQAGNEEEHAMATFGFLALTGDRRAVPLLRQGLLAPNPMVQSQAADGLARLQDNESVPLLIDACERAPSGAKLGLAEALASFDSPDALATARKYLPGAVFEEIRTRRAAGHGPNE
jgi:HEAT repeat protein